MQPAALRSRQPAQVVGAARPLLMLFMAGKAFGFCPCPGGNWWAVVNNFEQSRQFTDLASHYLQNIQEFLLSLHFNSRGLHIEAPLQINILLIIVIFCSQQLKDLLAVAVACITEFRAACFIFHCYMERMVLAISVLLAAKVNVGYWAEWMFADLKTLGQLLCQLPH